MLGRAKTSGKVAIPADFCAFSEQDLNYFWIGCHLLLGEVEEFAPEDVGSCPKTRRTAPTRPERAGQDRAEEPR
jgi:hypothetical protein